ncbi:radical SAM protein [Labilibacter sediminis]|nr:radical SAM protein [Labilibacter sediminis]
MKILLNCLPPADVHTPSISLSILKKFMEDNGVYTRVKYWNFSLSVMSEYTDSEDTEIRLIPFLSILNDRYQNNKGNRRIISLLQKLQPSYKTIDPHYYNEFLQTKKEEIYESIQRDLEAIDFSEISLVGITAKYNQWIPGIILAEEIKKIAPEVKVVVGGFGNDNVAREAMKLCSSFDFGTWGEGEYALLELTKQLQDARSDFSKVPRLIYKQGKELIQSSVSKSQYLDFDNYIYPDFSDFVNTCQCNEEEEDQVSIPINSTRSCHWKKCNFCDFNQGYKLRSRTPECIVSEIEHINTEYGYTQFTFVDSDTFGSLPHFERLLDLIIELKYKTEEDFSFWAEVIPNSSYSAPLMNKMAIAGFKNLFIGYDGLSDTLLQKMNKSTSFSDNIFFIKYSLKNAIYPVVNVIKHIVGETEEDVMECIDNLHYLRFFYHDGVVSFSHIYVDLVLSSMSKYYKFLPESEHERYNKDDLTYLLPDNFSEGSERFHLFRFKKDVPANSAEWEKLTEIEEYYKTNQFSYKVHQHNGVLYYTEYCNETEIENIVFGEPEYAAVLRYSEQQVRTFNEMLKDMQGEFPGITKGRLVEVLSNLKKSFLIYCNSEWSNIISLLEL